MNNRQAIKEAIKWGKEIRKRYIFGATAYGRGIEIETFIRESDRVKKIDDAINQLEQLGQDLEIIHQASISRAKKVNNDWQQLGLWEE